MYFVFINRSSTALAATLSHLPVQQGQEKLDYHQTIVVTPPSSTASPTTPREILPYSPEEKFSIPKEQVGPMTAREKEQSNHQPGSERSSRSNSQSSMSLAVTPQHKEINVGTISPLYQSPQDYLADDSALFSPTT